MQDNPEIKELLLKLVELDKQIREVMEKSANVDHPESEDKPEQ